VGWKHFIQCGLFTAGLTAFAIAAHAAPALTDAEFTTRATAAVAQIERDDGFSGVILVARGDRVLLRAAAGFADRERGIRNTPETAFPIESVTKQFTATAIMMLVQEGKVSLTDPISKYYRESPEAWRDVTIQHLLTHSSGIEDYWVHRRVRYDPELAAMQFRKRGDLFRAVENDGLGFQPGTGFSYSNAGFTLLAEVIERVSGVRYEDFLKRRIFAPLGMHHSGFGNVPDVKGYVRTFPGGDWQNAQSFGLAVVAAGAGGIYSTVDDMLSWSLVQDTDRLLSAQSRAAMFSDYGHNYGFGIRFAPKFGRNMIWHTGNDDVAAFAAIFDRFPEEQLSVIAMTNNTGITGSTATLVIEGKPLTFPATAMRKAVEAVDRLYFGSDP